jgi:hypothetical protein
MENWPGSSEVNRQQIPHSLPPDHAIFTFCKLCEYGRQISPA